MQPHLDHKSLFRSSLQHIPTILNISYTKETHTHTHTRTHAHTHTRTHAHTHTPVEDLLLSVSRQWKMNVMKILTHHGCTHTQECDVLFIRLIDQKCFCLLTTKHSCGFQQQARFSLQSVNTPTRRRMDSTQVTARAKSRPRSLLASKSCV